MREVQMKSMPGCCGMKVIYDFGHTTVTGGNKDYPTKKALTEGLRQAIRTPAWMGGGPKGIILATLNEQQAKDDLGNSGVPEQVLIEAGFVLVGKGYYPGHGNMVYLYILENEELKNQPARGQGWDLVDY